MKKIISELEQKKIPIPYKKIYPENHIMNEDTLLKMGYISGAKSDCSQ